ncbi:MAG: hypothetical protein RLZZ293_784 [Pseudomonadota bacterium]|jgi:chromosome partitioning protein
MKNSIIVVANQKGGVGKTTTVLNLASALAKQNRKKILVVDIDPQGNATTGAGIDKNQLNHSVYDVLVNDLDPSLALSKSADGFDILGANRHLAGAEVELVEVANREFKLKQALTKLRDQYDLILIDCPPALSLLTLNALASADYVLVPMQCEYYALEGLTDLLNTLKLLQAKLNPQLKILGIVRTMYDKRNNLAQDVSRQLVDYFPDKVFPAFIPRTVRLAEAPSYGMSAVSLDAKSMGAQAYLRLARELIKWLKA